MEITDIIWLEEVIDKITSKHNVTPEEVEQVFVSKPKFKKMHKGRFRGEDVYRVLGKTAAGRYLIVFFIHKHSGEALILSARDMDRKERKNYAKK